MLPTDVSSVTVRYLARAQPLAHILSDPAHKTLVYRSRTTIYSPQTDEAS